jgi:sodium-dependent dicarboxylate transporter 2/3/5
MPLLASVAVAMDIPPMLLMVPAALSASCAFMLPVATAPNAVVYGSGRVTIRQMAHAGLVLNLVGAVVITAVCYLLLT